MSYFAVARKRNGGLHDTQVRGAIKDRVLSQVKVAVYETCNVDAAAAQRYRGFRVYAKDSVYEYMLQNISDIVLNRIAVVKSAASSFNDE